jgi:hypothetical protein
MFNFPEHRRLDGMVAINSSNWYIKRLKSIKKIPYSGPLSHYFRMGGFAPQTPLHEGPHSTAPTLCLPCFKLLVTDLKQQLNKKKYFNLLHYICLK